MNLKFAELLINGCFPFYADFKKIFDTIYNDGKTDSSNNDIINSIDSVNEKLIDSKEIIEKALVEIEKQKNTFKKIEQEAQLNKQISNMNKEQIEALNKVLEKTLNIQEKKTFPKTFLLNLFFCLLSALLGYLLGKFM